MSKLRAWIAAHAEEIAGLVESMVSIPSVTGGESELARFCADWFERHGIGAELVPCRGRANAVGVVGAGERTLVLSGHLDTVPAEEGTWSGDPWVPRRSAGRIHGLGATDMKSSLAAAAFAARYASEASGEVPGRIVLAFTVEEETTGAGTVAFLDWAREVELFDFSRASCIVMEPTDLEPCLGNRGTAFLRVSVQGRGGHGSRPHLSRNPIVEALLLARRLSELEGELRAEFSDPDLGAPTLTPTCVQAGGAARANAIPERAELVYDCRVTRPLYENGFARLRARIDGVFGGRLEPGFTTRYELANERRGQELPADHELARAVLGVLRGPLQRPSAAFHYTPAGNDAVFFADAGIPTLNKLGPGHPSCAHRADEYVEIQNVLDAVELYVRTALAVLSGH